MTYSLDEIESLARYCFFRRQGEPLIDETAARLIAHIAEEKGWSFEEAVKWARHKVSKAITVATGAAGQLRIPDTETVLRQAIADAGLCDPAPPENG